MFDIGSLQIVLHSPKVLHVLHLTIIAYFIHNFFLNTIIHIQYVQEGFIVMWTTHVQSALLIFINLSLVTKLVISAIQDILHHPRLHITVVKFLLLLKLLQSYRCFLYYIIMLIFAVSIKKTFTEF